MSTTIDAMLVGCVSCGKSSALNAFVGGIISPASKDRQTFKPVRFNLNANGKFSEICKVSKNINAEKNKNVELFKAPNVTEEEISSLNREYENLKLHARNSLYITDFAGIGDERDKENLFYKSVINNIVNFNLVMFVCDANKPFMQKEEVSFLDGIKKEIKKHYDEHQLYIELIILVCKYDDQEDEELGDMFKNIEKTTGVDRDKIFRISNHQLFSFNAGKMLYLPSACKQEYVHIQKHIFGTKSSKKLPPLDTPIDYSEFAGERPTETGDWDNLTGYLNILEKEIIEKLAKPKCDKLKQMMTELDDLKYECYPLLSDIFWIYNNTLKIFDANNYTLKQLKDSNFIITIIEKNKTSDWKTNHEYHLITPDITCNNACKEAFVKFSTSKKTRFPWQDDILQERSELFNCIVKLFFDCNNNFGDTDYFDEVLEYRESLVAKTTNLYTLTTLGKAMIDVSNVQLNVFNLLKSDFIKYKSLLYFVEKFTKEQQYEILKIYLKKNSSQDEEESDEEDSNEEDSDEEKSHKKKSDKEESDKEESDKEESDEEESDEEESDYRRKKNSFLMDSHERVFLSKDIPSDNEKGFLEKTNEIFESDNNRDESVNIIELFPNFLAEIKIYNTNIIKLIILQFNGKLEEFIKDLYTERSKNNIRLIVFDKPEQKFVQDLLFTEKYYNIKPDDDIKDLIY